jgi:hypothetical protein
MGTTERYAWMPPPPQLVKSEHGLAAALDGIDDVSLRLAVTLMPRRRPHRSWDVDASGTVADKRCRERERHHHQLQHAVD